jgi:nicotinamidase-related amidase
LNVTMNPTRHSFLAVAEHSQLVIIDIQARLAAAMAEPERARVIRNTSLLARAAGLLSVPVIATEQYPRGLGPTDPVVAAALPERTPLLDKTCFACSGEETFRLALLAAERPQAVLAGMEAHVCVLQTALQLQEEYQVFVVEDAVCSRDPAHHRNAMERLRFAGVTVTNTESVLFEWLRDAAHAQFKAVSALIK